MSIEYVNPPELNDEEARKAENLCTICGRELGRLAAMLLDMSAVVAGYSVSTERDERRSGRRRGRLRKWRPGDPVEMTPVDDPRGILLSIADRNLRRRILGRKITAPGVVAMSTTRPAELVEGLRRGSRDGESSNAFLGDSIPENSTAR